MKTVLTVLFLLGSLGLAHGAESATNLPNAPQAHVHVFHATDYALAGSIAVTRFLDFTSTEECIRRPYTQCHEGSLPNALVHNKPAFAAYEIGCTAGLVFAQYELTKMGHRRIARTLQALDFAYGVKIVSHNYVLDTTPAKAGN